MKKPVKIALRVDEDILAWIDNEIKRHSFLSRSEYFDTLIKLAQENQRENNQYDPRQPHPKDTN